MRYKALACITVVLLHVINWIENVKSTSKTDPWTGYCHCNIKLTTMQASAAIQHKKNYGWKVSGVTEIGDTGARTTRKMRGSPTIEQLKLSNKERSGFLDLQNFNICLESMSCVLKNDNCLMATTGWMHFATNLMRKEVPYIKSTNYDLVAN